MNEPLVSIIIPTYNQREDFLRSCIESAIGQTYKNIVIIISDNHSTNNAPSVINEYSLNDNRIKVIKPSVFLNMTESFLFVFTQAIGKYCCYVSSDDILLPNCIEVLVEKLEENSVAVFAHGQATYFEKDGSYLTNWEYFN